MVDPDARYFEIDAAGEDADGAAVAELLGPVMQTLLEAPDGYRCDFELVIEEREGGEGDSS